MITIRQLAKEVGLSATTVSMVLNSAPLARQIPESTKKRVRLAAKKFGYSPNPFARSLFTNRSATVGILLSDITDPFSSEVLKGIDSSLHTSQYIPFLLNIQNSPEQLGRIQTLLDRRVEGLIGVATSLLLQTELLSTFNKRNVPLVLIGRDMEGSDISSVSIENEAGAFLAMKHLHDLGHRKIAFVKGPKEIVDSGRRWRGITDFATQAGLALDPKLTVQLNKPASSSEAGFVATQELMRRKRPFTALLAFDDLTAFGAIRAFSKAAKKVPWDYSVIGFDDVSAAAFYNPPLTTVRQPAEALGASAVEIFFTLAEAFFAKKELLPVHLKIKPSLVTRESTAAPRATL